MPSPIQRRQRGHARCWTRSNGDARSKTCRRPRRYRRRRPWAIPTNRRASAPRAPRADGRSGSVHVLLVLSSVAVVVLAGSLGLRLLGRVRGWPARRDLQVLVLAAPLVSLGLGVAALRHFAGQVCWLGAPPWDDTAAVLLPLGMGLVAIGALLLGVV